MSAEDPPRPPASRKDLARYLDLVEEEARAVLRRRRLPLPEFLDDAVQDGFLGLSRAFDAYDKEKNASFEAYARPAVRGEIIDRLDRRRRGDPVKVLLQGADSTAGDFAEHRRALEEELTTRDEGALESRHGAEGYLAAQGFGFLGAIRRLDPESALAAQRQYARALEAMRTLTAQLARREQTVIGLRQLGLRWADVAEHMGVAKATVQTWHAKALEQLRKGLAERGITEAPPLPGREDDEEED